MLLSAGDFRKGRPSSPLDRGRWSWRHSRGSPAGPWRSRTGSLCRSKREDTRLSEDVGGRVPSPSLYTTVYLSFSAGAARVDVGRIQHVRPHVKVCINAGWVLNDLDADVGVREGGEVDVGALHLSAHGVPEVKRKLWVAPTFLSHLRWTCRVKLWQQSIFIYLRNISMQGIYLQQHGYYYNRG